MSAPIHVLSELRHACLSCGGSCQGAHVRLVGDEEERIRRLAPGLGVADPIDAGKLRKEGGRCVFLGADELCEIHRKHGAEAKPAVCRQYPVIALRAGDGLRVGLDPGCYTAIRTWRDGPRVEDGRLIATPAEIPADQVGWEERIVDLCGQEDASLALLARALSGEAPDGPGALPSRFASRVVQRMREAPLPPLLELPDTAPMTRLSLGPVLAAARTWDPERPPPWPVLDAEREAWAVDAIRRMIWLRLAVSIPVVTGVALLMVVGAVACAWASPEPRRFGASLAAWSRGIRAPAFWRALTPDAEHMSWLARGGP